MLILRAPRLLILGSLVLAHTAAASPVQQETVYTLAYIDPGTGSFLIQALVAAVAGVAVTTRLYWRRIKVFLGIGPKEDEAEASRTDD